MIEAIEQTHHKSFSKAKVIASRGSSREKGERWKREIILKI